MYQWFKFPRKTANEKLYKPMKHETVAFLSNLLVKITKRLRKVWSIKFIGGGMCLQTIKSIMGLCLQTVKFIVGLCLQTIPANEKQFEQN